jgi:hypothetical protein
MTTPLPWHEKDKLMKSKYPQNMTYMQWRRTPFRTRHRLIGVMINDHLRHWRSCGDARCRRARSCQDYQCYWRRLHKMPIEESLRLRGAMKPLAQLLWIGCSKGSEGRPRY